MTGKEAYPERRAGGFTRCDGGVQFYTRVRALLRLVDGGATVLDFGAGRGVSAESLTAVHREVSDLRSVARYVIGVDVDLVVRQNPLLHAALVVDGRSHLPLADSSIDLVVSDHTFEHLADPAWAAAELGRVLRPGGWICARTPNKWGYIGVAARTVPNSAHTRMLSVLQPCRQAEDVFPTTYRLNTLRSVRRNFPSSLFVDASYAWDPEAAYFASSAVGDRVMRGLSRVTPERCRAVLMVFLQKRGA
jgi:SAM-dependent methyltransferase